MRLCREPILHASWLCVAVFVVAIMGAPAAAAAAQARQSDNREAARAARRSPVVQVFEATRGAVVNISSKEIVTVRDPFGFGSLFDDFFDMPFQPPVGPHRRQYTRTSVGSGFVIHQDGYIVTNAHVVAQTAERKAIFADGREYDAQIVALDTGRDLAILKIEADQPLPTLPLGRSDDLMIGETVIAIGNPLGFQHTVTAGVVSAIERDLAFSRGMSLSGLIQTDASINPGNSGGPLLNVLGELIGINTAIRGDAQNIGFAIPVDQLREVLPELLDIERRYRVECGVAVDTLNTPRVVAVKPESPAERAGLQVGDLLTHIDGQPIQQGIDFCIALIGCRAGQTITLHVLRDSEPREIKLTLQPRPMPDGAKLALEKLGLEVAPMPAELAEQFGVSGAGGLLITRVEPGGPADRTGIQPRDVLMGIGRHMVADNEDLGQLLELVRSGETLAVTVLRVDRRTKLRLTGQLRAR